nr:hypothetical protein [Tanacetum cinerariifolium]
MFDIDTLTQSMNYQPVVVGNQPNSSADPQTTDANAAFDNKENKCEVHVSPSSSDKPKKHDEKAKREAKGKSPIELSIRASLMGFMVYQMDVKSAFLYGIIEEEVYICQPQGFKDPDYPDKVYKVVKALYGLHQAHRAWYETLANYLLKNGFQRGKIDQTLFIKKQKDKFQMSSMGELTFFLGLQVKKKDNGIFISQDKYVAKILRKFGLINGKSASTPIDTEKPLLKDPDGEDVDVHIYRSMIGLLMYRTSSRPDIMFAVCACAHFQVTLKVSHLHAVKRISRYLKGKPHLGLWYPKDSPFNLTVVATSSTEAEYIAAASCCAQVLWIQNQLLDYRFSWVFFLATKDETSTILKTFFCGLKGIKREFSVARTPQQNGVAERKNKTLIEAAKTMLADSLLPIPFWAKAVNTSCYVQNRVLVTKPHNKTPYELLLSRTPSLGFMRPFGLPVTILNSLEPLGKFDGKDDKGFLVGYSVSSKAFRVFNNRTRIVQEILHINFLENQPSIAGSRPTWMFDIDTLTHVSTQQYVLLPLWSTGAKDPQTTDANTAFDNKENDSEVHVSPSSSDKPKKHDEKAKREAKGKSPIKFAPVTTVGLNSTNSTNSFNAAGPSNTVVSLNFKIGGKSSFVDPSQYPDDPNMPTLEDIIYSDDEEDVGADADFSNLEPSITVSPIPTTRVHKDHPVTQIIGDLSSTPQTRKEVYICQPQGFEDPDYPDKVYKVVKALYGLHQAHRAWYETLANYILKNSFQRGKIDQTLFIKKQKGDILLVQVYVDDIIFGSTNKELCKAFKKLMKDKFQMSLMGELTFFLGLQVKKKDNGIFISQDKYVAKILRKFGLTNGKSASTPIDTEKPLLKDPDGEDVDVHIYRYLKGKPHLGLWYPKDSPFNLTVVATSSTEAEYIAAASCCAQVLWIQNQLLDYRLIITTVSSKLTLFGLTIDVAHLMVLVDDLSAYNTKYTSPALTQKVFANIRRIGKGFSGVDTPLFDEQGKIDQAIEITKPKQRVKMLENKRQFKSSRLKRLRKGEIAELDADEDVTLVDAEVAMDADVQGRLAESQAKVYHLDLQHAKKVLSMQDTDEAEPTKVEEVMEVVTVAKLMKEVVTTAAATITAAQVPKTSAPRRRRGVVIKDPEETATASDATKKQRIDEEVEDLKTHLQIVANDDDDVYTEATPLALKVPVIDYQIHHEHNKPYYKIIKA